MSGKWWSLRRYADERSSWQMKVHVTMRV